MRALHPSRSQPLPRENGSRWELRLVRRKAVGSAAAPDGGDAEHGVCPQQQHSFATCPWPNAAYTVPLHSGYYPFPRYAEASEEAATFFAGLPVLLNISGSGGLLLPGDFYTLCSLAWSYEYLFFPGLCVLGCVWLWFFSSLILNTSYLDMSLRLCPMMDAKL